MPLLHPLPHSSSLDPAFAWPVKFCTYTTATCYVLSILTGNVSQVDRLWTFLPTIYTAYYALLPLWPHEAPAPLYPYAPENVASHMTQDFSPRAVMMLVLQVIWMCRLSYNTWRRGLFNLHDEDYRWEILRRKLHPVLFHLTNLVFIAAIQNMLLFLLALPTYIAAAQPHVPLGTSDYVLGGLALLTVLTEFVADNQQYSFQTFKHSAERKLNENDWPGARIRWTTEDCERGFVTKGLWAWSRHPNFLCEQTFWIIMNLVPLLSPQSPSLPKVVDAHHPVASLSVLLHEPTPLWTLVPALSLCALFFSSTLFTESISMSKYPEAYGAYRRRVAMFVPFLTPVWGLLLSVFGGREERERVDRLVYGSGAGAAKVKDQ
ncbi:DUF1295-domain-containing protein [Punctularia strigosozonata HHB-11173 SS5]|uniref:DUF1295-domain-containing protein n=1 Tax=Punctularia strigosozonata (strain HHB-11173) TaxID=741275 RepID=UPI00044167B6|nr:DUF1295-domain-containing protein [Punctularia strigosozonata HHB-11173 SS5]EIN09854.1 DUF1295-domain-containing protein [Punctularia strigosozonata HHB-11173 SS5]